MADPQGNATTYTYDAMDRVTTRSDRLGHGESLTYDLAGNLTRLMNRRGRRMKRKRLSEKQIIGILKEAAAGAYSFDNNFGAICQSNEAGISLMSATR